jgi:hypothetical protein
MSSSDRRPPRGIPSTAMISARANNRVGAVYSALHSFWMARQTAFNNTGGTARRDAYTVLLFNKSPLLTSIVNDFHSTPDQLLQELLNHEASGGTDFSTALKQAQLLMERYWSTERSARGCKKLP